MQGSGSLRQLVIPGEAVGGPGLKPGPGTYSEGGQIFASQMGIRNEREARKLNGGILMEVSPTKVARVIGKEGTMVSLIKDLTNCRIYVGQNGRIWLDGEDRDTAVAAMAIRLIEDRAQALGLTEAVR